LLISMTAFAAEKVEVNFVISSALNTSCFLSSTFFFLFNDTATTEIYTLSLHDALPICACGQAAATRWGLQACAFRRTCAPHQGRSEEHTSELQSRENLVCRLLLEKKKQDF